MVFLICRTGTPWRDLPEAFGNWNSIWRQFRRWCESGAWDVLLQGLADGGGQLDAADDRQHHDPVIDVPPVKKAVYNFRHLAVLAAGSPPFISAAMPSAFPWVSY